MATKKKKGTVIDHATGKQIDTLTVARRHNIDVLVKDNTVDQLLEKGRKEFEDVATLGRGMILHSITLGLVIEALHMKNIAMKDVAVKLGIDGALVTKFRKLSMLEGVPQKLLPSNYENAYRLLTQRDPETKKPVIQNADQFVEHAAKQATGSFAGIKKDQVAEALGVEPPEPVAPKTPLQKAKAEIPNLMGKVRDLLEALPKGRKGNKDALENLQTVRNQINLVIGVTARPRVRYDGKHSAKAKADQAANS